MIQKPMSCKKEGRMMALKISVLGPFQVTRGKEILKGFESNKVRGLLAYLAVEMDRPHYRESLAELLWPESPPQAALANLRYALANLRKVIGDRKTEPPYLLISRESLQFNAISNYELDSAIFSNLLTTDDIEGSKQALTLFHGDFLESFPSIDSSPFEEWVILKREQFRRNALEALHLLADHHEQRGEYPQALPFARRQVELGPWLEEAHQQLMRVLALDGQRGAALAQYEACRRVLASELDVEPSRETTRLYELIRDGKLIAPPPSIRITPEETPRPVFVGRQNELEQLDDFLDKALTGHGQVAFVTGSPGSGKTALVGEFTRRALDAHANLLFAAGNCNAYTGIGDPYLPFIEIIQLLTGDTEAKRADVTLTHRTARRLLAAFPTVVHALTESAPDLLDRFIPSQALLERARALVPTGGNWLEALERLIEMRGQAQGRDEPQQIDLFEQYVHVLSSIARQHPLILVVDDLQWVDSGSAGLLFHLGKRLAGQRILVLGAYRPEEISIGREGSRHPLESIINEFTRDFGKMRIELDRSEGRAFVEAYLDTEPNCLSGKFRETLYRHTSGHPLFTVELLRGLQERGDLIKNTAGQWTEGEALDWETLPPRVEAVIAERIARLPDGTQALLNAASVEGEEFTAEIVARACDVKDAETIHELSGALSKQHRLVRAQGTRRIGTQRVARYRFGHFLFQKYLYQRLDEIERPRLHETVGDALESLCGKKKDEFALQLARHFELAGLTEKAIDYLYLAGERAVRLLSNEEAITHYRHALDLLDALPDSPDNLGRELNLQISFGVPLLALRGFSDPELAQAYERAREICQQSGTAPELFHALRGLKSYYDLRGEVYTALDLGRQMLSIAEEQRDEDLLIMANNNMAVTLLYFGDLTAYRHYLDKVIDLYNFDSHHLLAFRFGYDPKVATLAHAVGLWMLGYPDQALQRAREAVRLADEIGQPFSQCFAYFFASYLHVIRREAQVALENAEKAVAFSEQHRSPFWLACALEAKGWAVSQLGDGEEGLGLVVQGSDMLRAIGSNFVLFATAAWQAETYGLAGKVEEGLSLLDELISQSIQAGGLYMVPQHYQCRGELLLKLRKASEAEVAFEKAIEIARQQGAKGWELRATLSLARLWMSQGKHEPAYHRLREVYDWFTEGFDTPDLMDAKALLEK